MPAGRPTDYNEDLAISICTKIAHGKSLVSICKADSMPNVSTVYKWLNVYKEFSEMYARAREDQADTLADQIIDIADEASAPLLVDGEPVIVDGKPVMVTDANSINHARLKADARKWVAAKLKPRKYGDRIQQDITVNSELEERLTRGRERNIDS